MKLERVCIHGQLLYEAKWEKWRVYGSTAKQAINNMLGVIYAVNNGLMYV